MRNRTHRNPRLGEEPETIPKTKNTMFSGNLGRPGGKTRRKAHLEKQQRETTSKINTHSNTTQPRPFRAKPPCVAKPFSRETAISRKQLTGEDLLVLWRTWKPDRENDDTSGIAVMGLILDVTLAALGFIKS